jgi:hypothetical protein
MGRVPVTQPTLAVDRHRAQLAGIENLFAASWVNAAPELQEYLVDAFQRTVLYRDLLRRCGNQEEEIESQSMATVLHFDHELLMRGVDSRGNS